MFHSVSFHVEDQDGSGWTFVRDVTLSFVPVSGQMIDPGDGNFYEVEHVYVKAPEDEGAPEGLEVWAQELLGATARARMTNLGWQVYDCPQEEFIKPVRPKRGGRKR